MDKNIYDVVTVEAGAGIEDEVLADELNDLSKEGWDVVSVVPYITALDPDSGQFSKVEIFKVVLKKRK